MLTGCFEMLRNILSSNMFLNNLENGIMQIYSQTLVDAILAKAPRPTERYKVAPNGSRIPLDFFNA